MATYCYECGLEIQDGDGDREHIPAQCMYTGYGDDYKKDRIIVPSHKACNHKYSKIDQELRDVIGMITNNQEEKADLTSKSVRSIFRRNTGIERINSSDGSMSIEFNYGQLRDLHIKNFKGIFYHKYGHPIPDKFDIQIIADGDQDKFSIEQVEALFHALDHEVEEWSFSGHPDIFKYKIDAIGSGGVAEYDENSDEQMIICTIVYHEEVMSMVFGATQNIIDAWSNKNG